MNFPRFRYWFQTGESIIVSYFLNRELSNKKHANNGYVKVMLIHVNA